MGAQFWIDVGGPVGVPGRGGILDPLQIKNTYVFVVVPKRRLRSCLGRQVSQFILGPIPRKVQREGPDSHFLGKIAGLRPVPTRIWVGNLFVCFSLGICSWDTEAP